VLTTAKIKIAVAPAAEYENRRLLFEMLNKGFPVEFLAHDGRFEGLQGLIVLAEDGELISAATARGIHCYQVRQREPIASGPQSKVEFGSSPNVPGAFRGAELADASLDKFCPVPQFTETLAAVDGKAVWSLERRGLCECHHVGIELPGFAADDFFHAHFRGARWFALLPLLNFIEGLSGTAGWRKPEPRAVFIIDDPNLHHRSYGYIDFAELARHAEANNYHATIATVPLDTWYFDREVAELFRNQRRRLSMMMHGVNHVADELARKYTEQQAMALLATGLRRIDGLELRAGVKVDRIMAAPHGAFAEGIADPMLRLGYEAGCVSVGSLVRWNPEKRWPADLGFPIAQAFGQQGFPVFHRVGTSETDVRLSAFLGHPVIMATHHQDYVQNFSRIEVLAKVVNDIAPTRWMSIAEISRTNYLTARADGVLCIKPYTRRLTIPVSQETAVVELEDSAFCAGMTINVRKLIDGPVVTTRGEDLLSCSLKDQSLEIYIPPKHSIDYRIVDPMPLGLWPVARRLLAEGRDRVKPLLSFASGH
jgi:hypothetical protein